MKSEKAKGIICGILSAICYGMNPLGALNLYQEGMSTTSVLFYRFGFAVIILACIMIAKRISFKVNKKQVLVLASLGVLFAISSLSLFMSFLYMPAGVASTLLFTHPIMVALIMAVFIVLKDATSSFVLAAKIVEPKEKTVAIAMIIHIALIISLFFLFLV